MSPSEFYGTQRFKDDLCEMNDDGEFSSSYIYICLPPKELEQKIAHKWEHAVFLGLDLTVDDDIFVYKLFDKRDKLSFFIVCMPYLSINILSSIFYGLILIDQTNSLVYTKTDRFSAQAISIIY